MSRGMHKGPRTTRSSQVIDGVDINWSSKKEPAKSSLERRQADFTSTDSNNTSSNGLLRHRPGSNKK